MRSGGMDAGRGDDLGKFVDGYYNSLDFCLRIGYLVGVP